MKICTGGRAGWKRMRLLAPARRKYVHPKRREYCLSERHLAVNEPTDGGMGQRAIFKPACSCSQTSDQLVQSPVGALYKPIWCHSEPTRSIPYLRAKRLDNSIVSTLQYCSCTRIAPMTNNLSCLLNPLYGSIQKNRDRDRIWCDRPGT